MGPYNLGESLLDLHRQDRAFYRRAYQSTLKSGYIPREWPRPIELGLFVVASVMPSSEECMDILGHSVGEAKRVLLGLAPPAICPSNKGLYVWLKFW